MFRPNMSSLQIAAFINDRIRQCMDVRPYWADLITPGILAIPDAYTTGTVSFTQSSKTVVGTGTAWPVSDLVNTTIPATVDSIGYVEVTPASMNNITPDSYLYIDAAGDPETVAVVEVTGTTFTAKFTKFHAAGSTVTASSLSTRQLRIGTSFPIFTVASVQTTTQLTMTIAWGGASLSGAAYQIVKVYFTLASDVKDILVMVDTQFGGWPIRLHVSINEMNWRDPQRAASGPPRELVDLAPNENGTMMYELWPRQDTARQLNFLYTKQWPELKNDNDRPPWFINPNVWVWGALADALMYKSGAQDPYFNPQLAQVYEQRFLQGVQDAKNADQSKAVTDFHYDFDRIYGALGGNFWIATDPSVVRWDL
jgi:hypothetical protein